MSKAKKELTGLSFHEWKNEYLKSQRQHFEKIVENNPTWENPKMHIKDLQFIEYGDINYISIDVDRWHTISSDNPYQVLLVVNGYKSVRIVFKILSNEK